MFPIRNGLKQRGALSLLFFKVAVQNAIRRVQVNEDGLKLTLNLLAPTTVGARINP